MNCSAKNIISLLEINEKVNGIVASTNTNVAQAKVRYHLNPGKPTDVLRQRWKR